MSSCVTLTGPPGPSRADASLRDALAPLTPGIRRAVDLRPPGTLAGGLDGSGPGPPHRGYTARNLPAAGRLGG